MSRHDKKDWNQFKKEHDEEEVEPMMEEAETEVNQNEGLDHPSYLALEEQLTQAEKKAHENWEKSVRAVAELENVRRRLEREVANALKFGVEKLISALLPVIDSLESALQMVNKEINSAMHEGLELTLKLFLDVLQKFEVEQINPVGAVFDPQLHEAIFMQEEPGVLPNTVISVSQKGYQLGGRVIRPARVVVSKK